MAAPARLSTRVLPALLTGALALGLTACGSSSSGAKAPATTGSTASAGASAAALPAGTLLKPGVLTVASHAGFVPYEDRSADGKTWSGMEIDLVNAIAAKLGLTVNYVQVDAFEQILPGLSSGRYDATASAFGDSVVKHAKYSIVDYLQGKLQFIATTAKAPTLTSNASLCGQPVGYQKGAAGFVTFLTKFSEATCASNPVKLVALDAVGEGLTQLKSGRILAMLGDPLSAAQEKAKTNGAVEAVLQPLVVPIKDGSLVGIVVPKEHTALINALQGGLKQVIADGTYASILAKYDGASVLSYTAATVNGSGN